ncbi:hypothetical protein Micbo1qcDRAFT_15018 [Microdochium bolleyi]|uniref:Uncharacterized protein n=1 Tax=Microdochium bolleyi TaxID=196109 RepID=A0A136IWR8_9PEZI|nr:hypothetical protein Micbo1qcDRAFT_15018 [Microdochium bolleyi]
MRRAALTDFFASHVCLQPAILASGFQLRPLWPSTRTATATATQPGAESSSRPRTSPHHNLQPHPHRCLSTQPQHALQGAHIIILRFLRRIIRLASTTRTPDRPALQHESPSSQHRPHSVCASSASHSHKGWCSAHLLVLTHLPPVSLRPVSQIATGPTPLPVRIVLGRSRPPPTFPDPHN